MDPQFIYESSVKLKIHLIDTLYNNRDWLTTSELSEQTKTEKKTVLKYLSEIKKDLELFNHPGVSMDFSKGRGTILSADNPNTIKKFILWIIKDSLTSKIIHTLFFENGLSITMWSLENYVSVSTTRRALNKLKNKLKQFNIVITSKKNIYYISGKEQDIRYMYYQFFSDLYKDLYWPFENVSENKIQDLLFEISIRYGQLSYQEKHRLSFFLAVNITRYFQNNTISLEEFDSKYLLINQKIFFDSHINEMIKKYFLISDCEIQFWLIYLQTLEGFYTRFMKNSNLILLHQNYQTDAFFYYQFFKKVFIDCMDLNWETYTEEIKKQFEAIALAIHYKMSVLPVTQKNLTEEDYIFELLHPQLIKKIDNCLFSMYELTNDDKFLNSTFFKKMYILLYELFHPLWYLEKKINIYLDLDQPLIIQHSIRKQVRSILSNYFNIRIYLIESLGIDINPEDIDLVISTSSIPLLKQKFPNSSFIYLEYKNKFTIDNIQLISKKLRYLIEKYSDEEMKNELSI